MAGLDATGILLILGLLLIPGVFFLLTLKEALSYCSPESRTMEPGEVWLWLIPLFNYIWQFIVVSRVASSLENEFRKRNIIKEPEPGKSLGMAFCVLNLCAIIPTIGFIAAIAGLVCWILYWVKISQVTAFLAIGRATPSTVDITTEPPVMPGDVVKQLERLAALRAQGILTEEEMDTLKKRIL